MKHPFAQQMKFSEGLRSPFLNDERFPRNAMSEIQPYWPLVWISQVSFCAIVRVLLHEKLGFLPLALNRRTLFGGLPLVHCVQRHRVHRGVACRQTLHGSQQMLVCIAAHHLKRSIAPLLLGRPKHTKGLKGRGTTLRTGKAKSKTPVCGKKTPLFLVNDGKVGLERNTMDSRWASTFSMVSWCTARRLEAIRSMMPSSGNANATCKMIPLCQLS